MNLENINLLKEKEFLSDSVKFYELKRIRPEIKMVQLNFKMNRTNPVFNESDFLNTSGVVFDIVNRIYLIGLAEYKTELNFEQFLYFMFINQTAWTQTQANRHRYAAYRRYENHNFRQQHKFKKKADITRKKLTDDDKNKKEWREYKGINKDKAKSRSTGYNSYNKADRALSLRRDRKIFRQQVHQGREPGNKMVKFFFDKDEG